MRCTRTLFVVVVSLFLLTTGGSAQTPRPESDPQNLSPIVASLSPSAAEIILPCPSGMISQAGNCPRTLDTRVRLTTTTTGPKHNSLRHTYKVNAGVINGEGANVTWDLSGVAAGTYTASVEKYDGFGGITTAATIVTVTNCPDCVPSCALCPAIVVACPDDVDPGLPITLSASVG